MVTVLARGKRCCVSQLVGHHENADRAAPDRVNAARKPGACDQSSTISAEYFTTGSHLTSRSRAVLQCLGPRVRARYATLGLLRAEQPALPKQLTSETCRSEKS